MVLFKSCALRNTALQHFAIYLEKVFLRSLTPMVVGCRFVFGSPVWARKREGRLSLVRIPRND